MPLFISFLLASLEQEFNNGCINKSRGGGSIEKKRRPRRKRRESSGFQSHRNPGSVLMDWALAGCRSRSQGWGTEEAVQDPASRWVVIPLQRPWPWASSLVKTEHSPRTLASQACCEVLMREGTALENDDHTKPQGVWILKTQVHVLKTL